MIQKHEIAAIANRFVALASSATMLSMNMHYLDIWGLGSIGLINIGILIFASISQFIGGASLIYLVPRKGESIYLKAAMIWILVSGAFTFIIQAMLDAEEIAAILGLGALQSFFMLCQMLLLSRNKLGKYQALLFIQSVSSVCLLALIYSTAGAAKIDDFILALFMSFTITAISGLIFTWQQWKNWLQPIQYNEIEKAGQLGFYTQTGNILHMLNNRSYLYFLEQLSLKQAGVFSAAMYIGEAILTVSKSLSAVQVAKIAQSDNHKEHKKLTLKYLWIGLGATALGIFLFFYYSELLTKLIFAGDQYIRGAFMPIAPGILAASCTAVLAHYFSGKGLNKYNAISSAVGFVTAIITGIIFIPNEGYGGAGKAVSITFIVQAIAQIILFRIAVKKTNASETNR